MPPQPAIINGKRKRRCPTPNALSTVSCDQDSPSKTGNNTDGRLPYAHAGFHPAHADADNHVPSCLKICRSIQGAKWTNSNRGVFYKIEFSGTSHHRTVITSICLTGQLASNNAKMDQKPSNIFIVGMLFSLFSPRSWGFFLNISENIRYCKTHFHHPWK